MNLELKKKLLMLDRIIKKIAPRILYLISNHSTLRLRLPK